MYIYIKVELIPYFENAYLWLGLKEMPKRTPTRMMKKAPQHVYTVIPTEEMDTEDSGKDSIWLAGISTTNWAALFQINYKILTMAADALMVALAQSECRCRGMQVVLTAEYI